MQIVINIPKEQYNTIKSDLYYTFPIEMRKWGLEAIRNSTPLPEGYGKLIILSEDVVKRELTPLSFSCQNWISDVGLSNATVAIIEADNVESEV